LSDFQLSRFERFARLLKSAGVLGVTVFVVNLFAFTVSVVTQEAFVCFKTCINPVSFYEHPLWFSILIVIHSVILIWGLSALWKALK
jgi:hypothetical protein